MSEKKKELLRTVKFTLFSASAAIVQVVSFAVMEEVIHAPHWLSYLVALVLSVVWNFTLNRKFTFHSAANVPVAMAKVALFYLVFTPLSTWWTAALTDPAVGWNEYLVLGLTMAVNFVTEYLYQRFVVFGKSIDTASVRTRGEKLSTTARLMLIPAALTVAVLTPPPATVMPAKTGIRLPKKSDVSRIASPTEATAGSILFTTVTDATAEIAAFTVGASSRSTVLPTAARIAIPIRVRRNEKSSAPSSFRIACISASIASKPTASVTLSGSVASKGRPSGNRSRSSSR